MPFYEKAMENTLLAGAVGVVALVVLALLGVVAGLGGI
jgi:hypothetical protein